MPVRAAACVDRLLTDTSFRNRAESLDGVEQNEYSWNVRPAENGRDGSPVPRCRWFRLSIVCRAAAHVVDLIVFVYLPNHSLKALIAEELSMPRKSAGYQASPGASRRVKDGVDGSEVIEPSFWGWQNAALPPFDDLSSHSVRYQPWFFLGQAGSGDSSISNDDFPITNDAGPFKWQCDEHS